MKVYFKNLYFFIFITCLLLSLGTVGYSRTQDSVAVRHNSVQVRLPDPTKLKELKADKDLQYFEEVKADDTLWQRLLYKIRKLLQEIFYQGKTSGFWEGLMYVALVVAIVFVIVRMWKVDVAGLLKKKENTVAIPYDVVEENIHELDLQGLIEEAITQHEHRKAIRLLYLQSLKRLTDAGMINWKPGKTNRSYIAEVQHPLIRQEFEQLTSMFEYVWYGGAALGATVFGNARSEFDQFDHLLKQHA